MYNFKLSQYCSKPRLLLCTSIACAILTYLGFWQLSRLREKTIFLESMHNNLTNPAIALNSYTEEDVIFKKVKLKGHFLPNRDVHLYGRKSMSPEKDGYYLLTPFQTNDNQIILIARGWFSSRHKQTIFTPPETKEREISSVVLPSEKAHLLVPKNDVKNNVWFTLNMKEISDFLSLPLNDFYIILDDETPSSDNDILKPLLIDHLAHIRNDHLEYALTWFGLAISLIVIFIIYGRNKSN